MTQERKQGPFEQLGETVGGVVGKVAGRANDMAMNAAGSVLGAALDQLGQWWGSPDAKRAAGSWNEDHDRACRTHFESKTGVGAAGYENARPTYQFGHLAGQNPDYQGKPFDQVEAELERTWEAAGKAQYGGWSDVRERVGFGYETVRTPGAPNPT